MSKRKRKLKRKKGLPKTKRLTPVQIVEYEITFEPIGEPEYDRLPESVKTRIDELYGEIQNNPQEVIPELLELKKKHPDVPQIYNYLAVAYSMIGDDEKSDAIIDEILQKKPDYLFARLNKAQRYLAKKEYEKIPELFNHKFDLKLLYPHRNTFHISEVANFMGIMGLYFVRTNQREVAEKYNEILQQLDPDYPIAKILNRELNPPAILQILKRLAGENLDE